LAKKTILRLIKEWGISEDHENYFETKLKKYDKRYNFIKKKEPIKKKKIVKK